MFLAVRFCHAQAHTNKTCTQQQPVISSLPALPQVSGHFTACSITVLEQRDGPQFIFGLDMLKRHQCVLDLAAGDRQCLVLGVG